MRSNEYYPLGTTDGDGFYFINFHPLGEPVAY